MYGGVSSDLLPFIFREGGVVCVFQVVEQCLLVITSLSAVLRYHFPGLTLFEAINMYIKSPVRQLPSNGQSFLLLQLHRSFDVFFT